MNIRDKETQQLIELILARDEFDGLFTWTQIDGFFMNIFPAYRFLDPQTRLFLKTEFRDKFFDKGDLYWRLKPELVNYIHVVTDPDPVWLEFYKLCGYISDNLYSTPFVVKCDDKDFLQGAMETALADVGEECWFDWFITHNEGEFYEIDRFQE